jgi:SAM-dependent methyltransferase
MSDWTAGYVADIGYTFGYYHELNPLRVKLAFANQGLIAPPCVTACELGFGQGLSIAEHASASLVSWYGTDFNPAQAANAQELTGVAGVRARLYDESFSEFADRADLPEFDYIGLHGIWSWVSDDNRQCIVDFIRRKLKAGGVLYISYNTLPGWAAFAPMRHLMTEHAEVVGSEGSGIVGRIEGALEFAEKLLEVNPSYARVNQQVPERVKKLQDQNRHYLAHEYFNRDWHPMHFATLADWLSETKLNFACSANYLDHIDPINLTSEQQQFLNEIPNTMFRESVRDFMTNQQFRKDYWVKGPRRLSELERLEVLRAQRVILATPRRDVPLKVTGSLGAADMTESIYKPILDALTDYKIHTIGEIEQAVAGHKVNFPQLVQAVMILIGAQHVFPVNDDEVITKVKKQTEALNRHLVQKARSSGDISYLVSPVTGGGHVVSRFQQLFMIDMMRGRKDPDEWASFAWQVLSVQGQKILKEGKVIESPEDNLTELKQQARDFSEKHIVVLKALKIL